jgi:hypothetical protein
MGAMWLDGGLRPCATQYITADARRPTNLYPCDSGTSSVGVSVRSDGSRILCRRAARRIVWAGEAGMYGAPQCRARSMTLVTAPPAHGHAATRATRRALSVASGVGPRGGA